MGPIFFLALILTALCQAQTSSYPCMNIQGVGCVCGQGFTNINGICTQQLTGSSQTSNICPPGQRFNGVTCVLDTTPSSNNFNIQSSPCLPNQLYVAGQCIPPSGNGSCPPGSFWDGSSCSSNNGNGPVGLATGTSSVKQQLSPDFQKVVCQTGYYFNCQMCLPSTGSPLCVLGCTWNGTTCLNSTSNTNTNSFRRGNQVDNNRNFQTNTVFSGNTNGIQTSSTPSISCPSGYQIRNNVCVAMTSNSNIIPATSQTTASIQTPNVICPVNYCFNGDKCIPSQGSNTLGNNQYCSQQTPFSSQSLASNIFGSSGSSFSGMSFVNSFTQNNQVGNIGSTGIMNNGPIGFQQSNINSFQNNPTSGFSSQPIYSGQSISSSQGLGSNYNQFQMGQNTQTYNNQGSNIQGSGWQTQPNLSQSSNLQRPSSNSGIPSCNPGEYWNGAKCTSS